MKISPGLGSLRSTSASSIGSEDSFDAPSYPEYQDLTFVKKLSDAKLIVYLVVDDKTNKNYAMKVFPYEDDAPSQFYLREVRFTSFVNPNIVSVVHYEKEQKRTTGSETCTFSYILMENAPYGDFFDVLVTHRLPFDEKLIRTYFHQLVNGVEALHIKEAAHLDLKLENLLMSSDFKLKIIDFDLSYMKGDGRVQTRGTKNFRAPELLDRKCANPQAADVFSMGVILFILRTGGMVPFSEDEANCLTLEEFKTVKAKDFWKQQCRFLKKSASFFTEDFKSLFMWMTMPEPGERPTLAQIKKKSKWYNTEIYSEEELRKFMEDKLQL